MRFYTGSLRQLLNLWLQLRGYILWKKCFFWRNIAANDKFVRVYEQISAILLPSLCNTSINIIEVKSRFQQFRVYHSITVSSFSLSARLANKTFYRFFFLPRPFDRLWTLFSHIKIFTVCLKFDFEYHIRIELPLIFFNFVSF